MEKTFEKFNYFLGIFNNSDRGDHTVHKSIWKIEIFKKVEIRLWTNICLPGRLINKKKKNLDEIIYKQVEKYFQSRLCSFYQRLLKIKNNFRYLIHLIIQQQDRFIVLWITLQSSPTVLQQGFNPGSWAPLLVFIAVNKRTFFKGNSRLCHKSKVFTLRTLLHSGKRPFGLRLKTMKHWVGVCQIIASFARRLQQHRCAA